MNALAPIIAALALAQPFGIVKGHVDLALLPKHPVSDWVVHFIKRPPKAGPGQMQPMIMILAGSAHLDSKGNFRAKLNRGDYEVDLLFIGRGTSARPLPKGEVEVNAGKTSLVSLVAPPNSER